MADANKVKVQQSKEHMTEKMTAFYELSYDKAQQYFNLPHSPEQSPVKHLVNEITEGGKAMGQSAYVYYQCDYCQDSDYSSLADVERHIWTEREDHEAVNLKRIEAEAQSSIQKISLELRKDIEDALQAKRNAEFAKREQAERNKQEQLRKELLFV
jgi:hypothetical protein